MIFSMIKHLTAALFFLFLMSHVHSSKAAPNSVLYTSGGNWLHTVNQITGAVDLIDSCSCNYSVSDLSSRPGEHDYVYGVTNFNTARLTRINIHNGHRTLFPVFDHLFAATGIAISRLNPDVAVVAGFVTGLPTPDNRFLWKVDLATGALIGEEVPLSGNGISKITYSLDGAKLYATDADGRLLTLDTDTGISTVIGDPGLTDFIEGLAFRPEDGALFAIDGGTADNLVIIDPSTGSLISTLGSLRWGGAHGLAFVIPEPGSLILFATCLIPIAFGRLNGHGLLSLRC